MKKKLIDKHIAKYSQAHEETHVLGTRAQKYFQSTLTCCIRASALGASSLCRVGLTLQTYYYNEGVSSSAQHSHVKLPRHCHPTTQYTTTRKIMCMSTLSSVHLSPLSVRLTVYLFVRFGLSLWF